MIKINKKAEYALMSLKFIENQKGDGLVSVREICDTFTIPFDTTAKVLQLMNNAGIVSSTKGIKGGYRLEKKLEDINIVELIRLVEGGPSGQTFCHSSKGQCDLYSICNISTPMEHLNLRIEEFLMKLSIKEVLFGSSSVKNLENIHTQDTHKNFKTENA